MQVHPLSHVSNVIIAKKAAIPCANPIALLVLAQGSFAQYIKLNARNAVKMDSNVSLNKEP